MSMSRQFARKIEDFTCGHCGTETKGNGYTDHCPNCLWGKHVDVNPGDRLAECKGMLKPIRVEREHDNFVIIYKCEKCGAIKRNSAASNDNHELLMKFAEHSR